MGVETSTKKTEPSDQSNMVFAIGKRNGKSNYAYQHINKIGEKSSSFFSQTANSEELAKQKIFNGSRNIN